MGFTNGLRAISLAGIVTLAAICAQPATVAAADPSPTPSAPAAATPDPSPSDVPISSPVPDPAAPAPTPDPSASPAPIATEPAPTPIPPASPAPGVVAVTPVAVTQVAVAVPRARVTTDFASRVVRIAEAQRGKRYARGATGPRAFDCSGLVRYAYLRAGVSGHLGGGHSARSMLRWARTHHLFSRSNPRVGDVVIYGGGTHAAIYIGRGLVINALNPRQGIRISGLHALRAPVTGFIHTRL